MTTTTNIDELMAANLVKTVAHHRAMAVRAMLSQLDPHDDDPEADYAEILRRAQHALATELHRVRTVSEPDTPEQGEEHGTLRSNPGSLSDRDADVSGP